MKDDACGIVVTFHPDQDVIENLSALRAQLERVIVVDNGSSADEILLLRTASVSLGFELIENGKNLGIATALNIGIRRAEAAGRQWIFLFDQDSRATEGFIETMLRRFGEEPEQTGVGILIPRYVDKRMGTVMPAEYESDGAIATAMTSGTLVRARTFREHGLFVDELFIDAVDHEFSLRLRAAGFAIVECPAALLLHSPGSPTKHRMLRKKPILSANYSAARRYYQERNKIWLSRRYGKLFPKFIHRQFMVSIVDFAKILLFEQDKLRKCWAFLRGVRDGYLGRMGPLRQH